MLIKYTIRTEKPQMTWYRYRLTKIIEERIECKYQNTEGNKKINLT